MAARNHDPQGILKGGNRSTSREGPSGREEPRSAGDTESPFAAFRMAGHAGREEPRSAGDTESSSCGTTNCREVKPRRTTIRREGVVQYLGEVIVEDV